MAHSTEGGEADGDGSMAEGKEVWQIGGGCNKINTPKRLTLDIDLT